MANIVFDDLASICHLIALAPLSVDQGLVRPIDCQYAQAKAEA